MGPGRYKAFMAIRSSNLSVFISDSSLTGVWTSADRKKSYPFELKERKTINSLQFAGIGVYDSAQYLGFKKDTPMLRISIAMTEASGTSEEANWLNGQFKKIMAEGNKKYSSLNLGQTLHAIAKEYVSEYKADVDSSLVGVNTAPDEEHYFLNREYDNVGNIIFLDNNFVSFSLYVYEYTGGAHGNYGTNVFCYDIEQKKRLKLNDILTMDSSILSGLLDKSYRKKYQIKASDLLSNQLFVDKIPVNDNFYITSTGIGFIYTPYEIAAYAMGQIKLWIPFSDLKPYLHPDFAKRIGLL